MYQVQAGLTSHPLELLLEPPSHMQTWIHQTIRAAAQLGVKTSVKWSNPSQCISERPNDRPIWSYIPEQTQQRLLRFNIKYDSKIRFVGDLADSSGERLATRGDLARRGRWSPLQCREYADLGPEIRGLCYENDTCVLQVPVGRTVYIAAHLRMIPVEVAPDGFFVVSQYVVRQDSLVQRGY